MYSDSTITGTIEIILPSATAYTTTTSYWTSSGTSSSIISQPTDGTPGDVELFVNPYQCTGGAPATCFNIEVTSADTYNGDILQVEPGNMFPDLQTSAGFVPGLFYLNGTSLYNVGGQINSSPSPLLGYPAQTGSQNDYIMSFPTDENWVAATCLATGSVLQCSFGAQAVANGHTLGVGYPSIVYPFVPDGAPLTLNMNSQDCPCGPPVAQTLDLCTLFGENCG